MHDQAIALRADLRAASVDQEKLTQELLDLSDARLALLKKYLESQHDETAKLQEIVDTLTEEKMEGTLIYTPQVRYMSDDVRRSREILEQYTAL